MDSIAYLCPATRQPLRPEARGLVREDGRIFPWLATVQGGNPVPDFLDVTDLGDRGSLSLAAYHAPQAEAVYRNFLDWLFQTFAQDEEEFRASLIDRLRVGPGSRVLVTGCGLGDDLRPILARIGTDGILHAQDLSPSMVAAAERILGGADAPNNLFLSVGDAGHLPFGDDVFDAALHFGGINLFDDRRAAIREMDRVVRPGGKVVFGDEGVAPWLRGTDYAKAVITNNPLWASEVPLELLPEKAVNVTVSWILGNCFYLVDFEPSSDGPTIDMDVPHLGRRGGTIRSRYYGTLEGVTVETRSRAIEAASAAGLSVHDWLERVIAERLAKEADR